MNKALYDNARGIIKKFIKKNYWHDFTSADIFYINDEKNKALFVFLEQVFDETYGLQLFFNKDGFNYVHDLLSSQNLIVTSFDCDSLCVSIADKKDLNEEEISFLKANKIRILEENNILIYRFIPGYKERLANDDEIDLLFRFLIYVDNLIDQNYFDLQEQFKKQNSCFSIFYEKNYDLVYRPLPYLEQNYRKNKNNLVFYNEFKDVKALDEEMYLFTNYLPVIEEDSNKRPIIFYFNYPTLNKSIFKYAMGNFNDYKQTLFGLLDEIFDTFGKPNKICTNNRNIYFYLYKTLENLGIASEFVREDENVNRHIDTVISNIYQRADKQMYAKEEFISMLTESINSVINDIEQMEIDDDGQIVS